MKLALARYLTALLLVLLPALVQAASNFITIKLPEAVSVDLPRNWVLISNNKRITLDTTVESTFDINNISREDSTLPFAANYYDGGVTMGIVNARYFPTMSLTQVDTVAFSNAEVLEIDHEIRTHLTRSIKAIGGVITSWEGTEKRRINGVMTLVTEYHRKAFRTKGTFRVRLVRVLAGDRSFTLTISYLESQARFLKSITDRMILSLSMG